jgi:hypothetical protein
MAFEVVSIDILTEPWPAPKQPSVVGIAVSTRRRPSHRMVGMTKSAPDRMPVGQRAVIVFSLV